MMAARSAQGDSSADQSRVIDVVAGVLRDNHQRVLLAQRSPQGHLPGLWEFPGGKREPGESLTDALRRELVEEIGTVAETLTPLIEIPWRYADKSIRLHVFNVKRWSGKPQSREQQALSWQPVDTIMSHALPAADRPVLAALKLPHHYAITPPDIGPDDLPGLLPRLADTGIQLLCLRLPAVSHERMRGLLESVLPIARHARIELVISGDFRLARAFGIGVQLRASQLRELAQRPMPASQWVGASCHDAIELRLAAALGVDFATLSPVQATPSHPQRQALGWEQVNRLVAATPLPVYALGGVGHEDLSRARDNGAIGVAGIRAFWPRET